MRLLLQVVGYCLLKAKKILLKIRSLMGIYFSGLQNNTFLLVATGRWWSFLCSEKSMSRKPEMILFTYLAVGGWSVFLSGIFLFVFFKKVIFPGLFEMHHGDDEVQETSSLWA